MSGSPIVIKIGGHEIEDESFLQRLASVIRQLEIPVIIVHGGGKEISTMQEKLGIQPHYVDGVRVTDAESLAVVTMILCGVINKRVVRIFNLAGLDAQGMSGVDRILISAVKMPHSTLDMGFTGEVVRVKAAVLHEMLATGVTPVIAPICHGDPSPYNVNADHVAGAVAAAIGAERIVFITNVEGVLVDNAVTPALTKVEADKLIADGTISGGMIPKVQTALYALDGGVQRSVITNLVGLETNGGTVFTK